MRRIVIDTNVLVSALITKGYSSQIIYDFILSEKAVLCLSPVILSEYVNVLFRAKFTKYPSFVTNAEIVLAKLEELAVIYEPTIKIDILEDKDDNKFLELAVIAGASYVVTGNTNDFRISEYQNVKIVTPKECWEKLNSADPLPSFFGEPQAKYLPIARKVSSRRKGANKRRKVK